MRTLTVLLLTLLCLPLAACDNDNYTYVDAKVIRCDRITHRSYSTVFETEDGTRFKKRTTQNYSVGRNAVVEIELKELRLAKRLTKLSNTSEKDPYSEFERALIFNGTVQGFIKDSNRSWRTVYEIDDGKNTRVISHPHGSVKYETGDVRLVTLQPENYARARVRELASQQLINNSDDLAAMSDIIVPRKVLAETDVEDPLIIEGFLAEAQADAKLISELDEQEDGEPQTVASRYENQARQQIDND